MSGERLEFADTGFLVHDSAGFPLFLSSRSEREFSSQMSSPELWVGKGRMQVSKMGWQVLGEHAQLCYIRGSLAEHGAKDATAGKFLKKRRFRRHGTIKEFTMMGDRERGVSVSSGKAQPAPFGQMELCCGIWTLSEVCGKAGVGGREPAAREMLRA